MFGYTTEEALGRQGTEWIAPEYRELVKKNMLMGHAPPYEVTALRKDGTTFPCEIQGKAANFQGRQIRVTALRDITELKKAEKALRLEKERAEKYLEIAGVIIVALDPEGRVSLINRTGCEMLGYQWQEIIGTQWFDAYLPESDRDRVRSVFSQIVAGEVEAVTYYENPVLTRSGEERLIAWYNSLLCDEEGNINGTLSSGEDITERVRAEKELRESRERFRQLSEVTREGIIFHEQGVVADINRQFEEMFGYDRSELLGKQGIPMTIAPECVDEVRDRVKSGIEGKYPYARATGNFAYGQCCEVNLRFHCRASVVF